MLSVFFYNMRTITFNTRESASLAFRECNIFWDKVLILVLKAQHCINKLLHLYEEYKICEKKSQKVGDSFRIKKTLLINKLYK